jgi:hypothetical protein
MGRFSGLVRHSGFPLFPPCQVSTVLLLHLRYAMPPRQVSLTLSGMLLKGLPTTA